MLAFINTTVTKSDIIAQLEAHALADEIVLRALRCGAIRVDVTAGKIYSARWRRGQTSLGCKNAKGYIVFTIHIDGVRSQAKAHRTVWIAAHGPIPRGLMIDHINGVKNDNRIFNLRLADSRLNAQNRRDYRGANNPSAKLNQAMADEIRDWPESLSKTAAKFMVSKSLVAQIKRGELWKC